jgi:predicted O-methyltransferase YrrM
MAMQIRRWAKSLLRVVLKSSTERAVSSLCRDADGVVKLLGIALEETLHNQFSLEEKTWVDSVESLRHELSSSSARISIDNFGAVEPGLRLSEDSMYTGRRDTRSVGEVCRDDSMPSWGCLLLFKLIRKFRPAHCVELGTCLGISASFEAAALKLNGSGQLTTLEGAEALANLAEGHFRYLGLDNVRVVEGRFQDTLDDVLKAYKPIDYVFIDGHHDEKATTGYFRQILPFLGERALLVFDDISWSQGMRDAWKVISGDERVDISLDLRKMGVCVIEGSRDGQKHVRIPIV